MPLAPATAECDRAVDPTPDAALNPQREAPRPLHVAYLTNVYPKTSHTFIRNEIAALARQGITVTRLTIREPSEPLVELADIAEAARSMAVGAVSLTQSAITICI